MKSLNFMLLLICTAFLGSLLAISFYSFYLVYDVKYLPMDVKVSNHYGLNLDTDAVHFGRVTTPGGAGRSVIIANTYDKPVEVLVSSSGKIASWLTINESRFIMGPGANREVMLTLDLPSNISYGNYTGTLKILFKRVLIYNRCCK